MVGGGIRVGRSKAGRLGLDLADGTPTLSELRFADNILLSVTRYLFILCLNACQSLSTRGAHPTIERDIRFLTTSSFGS